MTGIDCRQLLQFIGNTQHARFLPVTASVQKGEAAVIVAATHTEPVAICIETNQRCQYEVQRGRLDQSPAYRFGNAVAVINQLIPRFEAGKPETTAIERSQYRQVDYLAERPETVHQWQRVHLAVGRQKPGNVVAVQQQ